MVYAISSKTQNYIYVGLTANIDRRFRQHNDGKERTTRSYRPFELLHIELLPDRPAARKREKYLKSGIGKEFLRRKRNLL
jgi:putative endonuclease